MLAAKFVKKMTFVYPGRYFLIVLLNLSIIRLFAQSNPNQAPLISPFEILISEIMADPIPSIALPECEYIELYNRGSRTVDLKGCILSIGHHVIKLPVSFIPPGAYAIVCDDSDVNLLKNFGATVAIEAFPPILNTGQIINLKDSCGAFIHSVSFNPDWYNLDPDGGRSLELIDPENPCGKTGNWLSSKHPAGGTPGSVNSVYDINPDRESPVLVRATMPSKADVLLNFNESLHPADLLNVSYYSVSNNIFHPDLVVESEHDYSKILLHYGESFQPGIMYTVSVLNQLKDCAGNPLQNNAYAEFAIPQSCQPADVIINEVLFNGSESITEFIELYNRSSKTIDLASTSVFLADVSTGQPVKNIQLTSYPFLLLPGHYVVLTEDAVQLMEGNPKCSLGAILEIPDFFKLPDKEGMIVLADTSGHVLDEFLYSYKMHLDLLKDLEGISLEKINPGVPSSDSENWMSASSVEGYSTPGRENSQLSGSSSALKLTLSPEFLSPDGDGLDDYITLHLTSDFPGWLGSLMIYDTNGKLIKTIFHQALVGTDEYFTWDGKNQEGKIVTTGFYIVYGELFSQQGGTKNFKKVFPVIKK